jgi:hypothetical protein
MSMDEGNGAIPTLFSFDATGRLVWNNSLLLPTPAYPFLDVDGDALVSDGRFLQTLNGLGRPLVPQEDIVPSLYTIQRTPTLTEDDVLMFGSSTGHIAGYLTDGTPHASLALNTTWPEAKGLVVPLAPMTVAGTRIFFPAISLEAVPQCSLFAFDVTRSLARRLSLAWRLSIPCPSRSSGAGAETEGSPLLPSVPFVQANDTVSCVGASDETRHAHALACYIDNDTFGKLLFSLPLSAQISALALAPSTTSDDLVVVSLVANSTILVVNISLGTTVAHIDLCASSSDACSLPLPHAPLAVTAATNASAPILLALTQTASRGTSPSLSLELHSPAAVSLSAFDLTTLAPLWTNPVPGALQTSPASQILPLTSPAGKTLVTVAVGNTVAAFA